MSAVFSPRKPIPREVKRLARKLTDNCVSELEACRGKNPDDAVHAVRKSLKRLRALLRLVRTEVDPSIDRREDERFRDISRRLNEARDDRIALETLRELACHAGDEHSARMFLQALDRLESRLAAKPDRAQQLESIVSESIRSITRARKHIRKWSQVPDRWRTFARGLKDTYRRGAETLALAAVDSSAENLHQWRKHVRYLSYQLAFLRRLGGKQIRTLSKAANELNQLLGAGHDLAILKRALVEMVLPQLDAAESQELLMLVEHRRSELARKAFGLGNRFFQDRPRDWGRQLKAVPNA